MFKYINQLSLRKPNILNHFKINMEISKSNSNEILNGNKTSHGQLQNQSSMYLHSQIHKREPSHRVFVNRSLQLSKIKFYGFDMDYTLAVYKSPQYEILTFNMVIEHLVSTLGYPNEIKKFVYDPSFPVRGLWYDKKYGHLLKVDAYGNILICVHGFQFLKSNEIRKYYPNKFINFDESRIFVLNTLFNLPETYLLACLINFFTTSPNFEHHETGVSCGELFITFQAIYQDVRCAIDAMHNNGKLKQITVDNLEEYVVKDQRLPLLFNRMHEHGAKVFLLTNSGYDYTDRIMSYMLNNDQRNWKSYFDYIVVDAMKPLFFEEGTSLKAINIETGNKLFGSHSGPLVQNQVYSGGSCDVFSKLIGSRGKDVLYVGDHIFGDIIKSKKERAWRTFLVIPELAHELTVWHEKRDLFTQIEELESIVSDMLINLDSSSKQCPDVNNLQTKIQRLIHEMDMRYGLLGSLFRSGSRQTHFAAQITRYADIYAPSHLNLLHYPFFYLFKAPPMLMPHESTVNPNEEVRDESLMKRSSRTASILNSSLNASLNSLNELSAKKQTKETDADSLVFPIKQNDSMSHSLTLRPDTPSGLTHHADFDDDDEESDESK